MDRIDQMKAFVLVAQLGSFTKAAEKLSTSNQLVSKYVSSFEAQLGVRLFNRTTRRVHLTQEGEQCLQHAQLILESVGDMENHFGQMQQKPSGTLRITAPVSFSTQHLSPLLKDFKKEYSQIGINLELSDRKVDVIEEGFDLAIRIGQLKSSSLIAKKITDVKLVLCAAPSYIKNHGVPEHPNDLIASDFLYYNYFDYMPSQSPLIEVLHSYAQNNQLGVSTNNGEILTELAIAGVGYVLQPTFIVGEALKQGKLATILDQYAVTGSGLYAVYPHRKLIAPKLRVFIDYMSNYYGSPPYWDTF